MASACKWERQKQGSFLLFPLLTAIPLQNGLTPPLQNCLWPAKILSSSSGNGPASCFISSPGGAHAHTQWIIGIGSNDLAKQIEPKLDRCNEYFLTSDRTYMWVRDQESQREDDYFLSNRTGPDKHDLSANSFDFFCQRPGFKGQGKLLAI